ncbi:MAG TPA: hypothetical protein VH083_27770 [Myxococcales bacterium]|jgi:hypothetical protein|nr:hypothetical protein [Myxococcales bacterium]
MKMLALMLLALPLTPQQQARRDKAEKICRAQGPTCKPAERPNAPRDLTGIGCVCEPGQNAPASAPK